MAKWAVFHKPRDLPITTTMCTNCGQWLDFEETIEGAMLQHCEPKGLDLWIAWADGKAPPR
jgi:hypothetical protein